MTAESVEAEEKGMLAHILKSFASGNPITVKELRGRMRGRRAFIVLTLYLLIMSGFITLIYAAIAASAPGPTSPELRGVGKFVFAAVVGVQLFLTLFVSPALTAGAISGEKERKTYELLRTTPLPSKSIVLGKLLSALSYVMLLVLASVPLQSIAYLMGGISVAEIAASQLVIVVGALAYAMIGLFISSMARTTTISSVATYSIVIFLSFGIPLLVGGTVILFESFRYGPLGLSATGEIVFNYFLIFMAAVNLPASIVVSEVFLLENGSLLGYESVIGFKRIFLMSPWYLSLMIYGGLAILLLYLTINRIKRVARH